jgi:DNA-binding MarR family transcriptional regulator
LNVTAGASNRLCQALLAPHGLQLGQWVILSALWRRDGQLTSELAGYTGNALPATSRIIDRMIKADLVSRTADPADRRAARIRLTAKGRSLEPLAGFWVDVNERLLDGFSEVESRTLFALLERVLENARLGAARDGRTAQGYQVPPTSRR